MNQESHSPSGQSRGEADLTKENPFRGRRFAFWPTVEEGRPTVLALHGFTGAIEDTSVLAETAPWLNWLAPALPGHDIDTGHAELWALRDLGAYLQALWALCQAGQSRILMGYSMGGRLALHCALERPELQTGLVLVGASPGLRTEEERTERRTADAALAEEVRRLGQRAFLANWAQKPLIATQRQFIHPNHLRLMDLGRSRHRIEGLCQSLEQQGTGALPSLWDSLEQLNLPVLLVTGSLDAKFGGIADAMAARLPRAHRVTLEGVGHAAHLEAPEAFSKALEGWMEANGLG